MSGRSPNQDNITKKQLLMRYESRAVYFEHEYVVHNSYLPTFDELHLTLMAVGVYGEADAHASIYVSALGEKPDVERHTLHIPRCLRRVESRHTASRARVVPLPFFDKTAQLCIRLG